MGGRWWPGTEPPERFRNIEAAQRYAAARYAPPWRTWTGEGYAMADNDRPDPLAEPPRRQQPDPAMAELSGVCGYWTGDGNCDHPVCEVWWIGCTEGEHAGPSEWCRCHARLMVSMGPQSITCGQCSDAGHGGVPMRVFKRTRPDGQPMPLPFVIAAMDGDKLRLLTELFGGGHG